MLVFYQHTYDANVGPGDGSTPLVQSATSRAFALELSESFLHGDVMLAVRPVEYLSGLQASATGFDTERTAQPHYGTFNVIARDPKFSPYLYFVFESGVGAASDARYAQPAWTAQVRWAAPVFGAPAIRRVPAGLRPVAVADATQAASTSVGTSDASPSPEAVQAGKAVFVANCAACHMRTARAAPVRACIRSQRRRRSPRRSTSSSIPRAASCRSSIPARCPRRR